MSVQTMFRTIGEIKATNTLSFLTGTDAFSAAMEMLDNHVPEAPVTDPQGKYVGLIGELGFIEAIQAGRDLAGIPVEAIMRRDHPSIGLNTTIEEAVRIMAKQHLKNLPVLSKGYLIETVSRHDLLRVLLGIDLGIES